MAERHHRRFALSMVRQSITLIAKYKKSLSREYLLLVFTTLVCLSIQQVGHAKAVNTNLSNQLKRGNRLHNRE
jgi:hypothetical protein